MNNPKLPTDTKISNKDNWEESLNIEVRFTWATKQQQKHILAEIKFQRESQKQDIIEELPKPRKHAFTCCKYSGTPALCDCGAEGESIYYQKLVLKLKKDKR